MGRDPGDRLATSYRYGAFSLPPCLTCCVLDDAEKDKLLRVLRSRLLASDGIKDASNGPDSYVEEVGTSGDASQVSSVPLTEPVTPWVPLALFRDCLVLLQPFRQGIEWRRWRMFHSEEAFHDALRGSKYEWKVTPHKSRGWVLVLLMVVVLGLCQQETRRRLRGLLLRNARRAGSEGYLCEPAIRPSKQATLQANLW